jgi:ribosomal-protein-alanine N-acetyltransferase
MPEIRRGEALDLAAVAAIQAASPGAAQWKVESYLTYEFLVATLQETVAGFLLWRTVGPGEREVLNLAVSPHARRKGVGRALIHTIARDFAGVVFLEVRESNKIAQMFYESLGFQWVSVREKYYDFPSEAAIVMKFHSC